MSLGVLDPRQAAKELKRRANAIQFSGVVALTWTAKDAQEAVRGSILKNFINKDPAQKYSLAGVAIVPATLARPTAEVYHRSNYLARHEIGGEDIGPGRRFPAYIPVAAREVFGIPANKVIPKALRAKPLVRKKTYRGKPVYRGLSRTGVEGVFWGRGIDRRMLYLIRRSETKRSPRPWFYKTVARVYDVKLEPNYNKALAKYAKG